jgi:hypothetical protein
MTLPFFFFNFFFFNYLFTSVKIELEVTLILLSNAEEVELLNLLLCLEKPLVLEAIP